MDFYGESSSTDYENVMCKICEHRNTAVCRECKRHEWNQDDKTLQTLLEDLYEKKQ